MSFQDKVVIVTGASQGIGKAIAEAFAAGGAALALFDLLPEVESTARELSSGGHTAVHRVLDVTDPAAVKAAVDSVARELGGIDVLVNNAGVQRNAPIDEMTEQDWDFNLSVNLKAIYLLMHEVVPHLKKRVGSSVVNIASIHAGNTLPTTAAYAASKAGVLGLTRSTALELAPAGVRVNAVNPGTIGTAMFYNWLNAQEDRAAALAVVESYQPIGRIGSGQDIADAVVFLASERASFITGQALGVDGGASVRAYMA